jgi:hypothetical protein
MELPIRNLLSLLLRFRIHLTSYNKKAFQHLLYSLGMLHTMAAQLLLIIRFRIAIIRLFGNVMIVDGVQF